MSAMLWLGSALTLGVALAYALTGAQLARRAQRTRSAPLGLFSAFWSAIAFYGATDALWSLAVALGDPPLAIGITILHAKLVVAAIGFLGLLHYLLFMYTGRSRMPSLIAFYSVVVAVNVYAYALAQPIGQEEQTWRAGLVYARDAGAWDTAGVVLLFLPPLLASIAYAALLPRAGTRAQRRRMLAVSASLAVFFGGMLVGWILEPGDWWALAERLLALGAAAGVAWAHRGTAKLSNEARPLAPS